MHVPPTGHSSSIDSTSSFSSSKSSLLAPPIDEVSSQSDIADPKPSMPRGDSSAYAVAASPSQAAYRSALNPSSAVSATQKFKRAFGKRRRPAGTLMASSGDERYPSDSGPSSYSLQPSSSGLAHSSTANIRPSAAKLTMHLFGGRHAPPADPHHPPPPPPKPAGLRPPAPPTLMMPANTANKLSANTHQARPRSSVMTTSPSITAAIEFMREDETRQQAAEQHSNAAPLPKDHELEQNKEDWRKSDSTMDSGHTVKPAHPPDSGPGAASKRLSAFSFTPPTMGDLGLDFLAGAPVSTSEPGQWRQDSKPAEASAVGVGKQSKRRSLSLNIQVPSVHLAAPLPTHPTSLGHPLALNPDPHPSALSAPNPGLIRGTHSPSHSVPLMTSQDSPTLTRTAANGIIGSGTASGSPVSKTNIRGRLAAWTAAAGAGQRSPSPLTVASSSSLTSPSVTSLHQGHRRVPVTSTASQPSPEMQAIAAAREMQNRTRSPSGASISSAVGIRQAATSLTSGAGAMALGLGKRAYEKVGRVWGGSSSGSGSDTPSSRPPITVNGGVRGSSAGQTSLSLQHGPSAFPAHGRRTPNAPSGTWSVSSLGGSRSSSEKDRGVGGRETPPSGYGTPMPSGPGKLVRSPRSVGGGVVFGRELWECVRDTRSVVVGTGDDLSKRLIPALVLRCAQHLHKWGMEEEGLFRISGRSSHINRLRNEFDSGADYDIIECAPAELDPHAVASVFKAYLRELPEPILTRALEPRFDAAMTAESSYAVPAAPIGNMLPKAIGGHGPSLPSGPRALPMLRKPPSLSTFTLPTSSSLRAPSAALVEELGDLVSRLPRENHDLLLTVVELMKATAARSKDTTKMPLSNLLLVFCPSLRMTPTLLRVLCDAPGLWLREYPVVDISRTQVENDSDSDGDESTSDTDSNSVDGDVVVLPRTYKGKERETTNEDSRVEVPPSTPPPEKVPSPQLEESLASIPVARPRAVRRVPVPALLLEDQHLASPSTFGGRSSTPPPFTEPPSRSESTLSLEVPSRSLTPLMSPPQSAVSLTSAPGLSPLQSAVSLASAPSQDSAPVALSPRTRQFSSPFPSSGFVPPMSWAVPNHDKSLPASPHSPTHPVPNHDPASSTSHLRFPADMFPERSSSLPTSLHIPSHSAPSVAFPSRPAKTTPTTPTSLKKHTLALSLGRSPKSTDDEDVPSPSKRLVRRPSLNMLFNMKRSGSPSPRSRTPTISSPLSSPVAIVHPPPSAGPSPKTVTNPFPPVLSLPIEGSMDVGLGWDDAFGGSSEGTQVCQQPRPTVVSQPTAQPPVFQPPPSPTRRPATEFLTSSGGFFSTDGPPLVMPSATAVLEVANAGAGAPYSPVGSNPEESSGDESPVVDSPVKEVFSPPPHLSFQFRRSSMEEDWASAVLLAAGKPAESFA